MSYCIVTKSCFSTTMNVQEACSGDERCDLDVACTCTVWTLGRPLRGKRPTSSSTFLRPLPTVLKPKQLLTVSVFPSMPTKRTYSQSRALIQQHWKQLLKNCQKLPQTFKAQIAQTNINILQQNLWRNFWKGRFLDYHAASRFVPGFSFCLSKKRLNPALSQSI